MLIKFLKQLKTRLKNSWCYSIRGLSHAIEHEQAFRLEIFAAALLAPVALVFGRTGLERAVLIASLLLVFIVELLNSAIEAVVDRIGLEHNELSGRAKDIASSAVFVALWLVPITYFLILW